MFGSLSTDGQVENEVRVANWITNQCHVRALMGVNLCFPFVGSSASLCRVHSPKNEFYWEPYNNYYLQVEQKIGRILFISIDGREYT